MVILLFYPNCKHEIWFSLFAILVMGTALVDWNEGVCEAAQKTSNVTHFSEHTIRNWMQLYIQSTSDLLSDGKDTIRIKI